MQIPNFRETFFELTAVANAPGTYVVRAISRTDGVKFEMIEVCASLAAALQRVGELAARCGTALQPPINYRPIEPPRAPTGGDNP